MHFIILNTEYAVQSGPSLSSDYPPCTEIYPNVWARWDGQLCKFSDLK